MKIKHLGYRLLLSILFIFDIGLFTYLVGFSTEGVQDKTTIKIIYFCILMTPIILKEIIYPTQALIEKKSLITLVLLILASAIVGSYIYYLGTTLVL